MERVGAMSVKLSYLGGRKHSVTFRHETRASVEMFLELVLSIQEGPMRPEKFEPDHYESADESFGGGLDEYDDDEDEDEFESDDGVLLSAAKPPSSSLAGGVAMVLSMRNNAFKYPSTYDRQKSDPGALHMYSAAGVESQHDIESPEHPQASASVPSVYRREGTHRMPFPVGQRPSEVVIAMYTWNMGNVKPDTPDEWIIPSEDTTAIDDIIVVSIQEYTFETGSAYASTRQYWQSKLSSAIGSRSGASYTCLTHVDSWNRMLSVFVREPLVDRVTHLKADTIHVGVAGVGVNKGAIGVRFSLFDTDFCFVNSHLAAHQNEVSKRNEDFEAIVKGLKKLGDNTHVDITVSQIHHLFWMGDLNYRIDLDRQDVMEKISFGDYRGLESADQLHKQILDGKAFFGFKEAPLDFDPTYKYVPGMYDNNVRQYSAEKNRIPAWCDRILMKSLHGVQSKILEYNDVQSTQILTSDHSPVFMRCSCQLIHTSGLRGRNTMLRLSRDTDLLYLKLESLVVKPLPRNTNAILPTGDWTCTAYSRAFSEHFCKSNTQKDTRFPSWKGNVLNARLIENKLELLAKKFVTICVRCSIGKNTEFTAACILGLSGSLELGAKQGSRVGEAAESSGNKAELDLNAYLDGINRVEFHETLLHNGVPVGVVDGEYTIFRPSFADSFGDGDALTSIASAPVVLKINSRDASGSVSPAMSKSSKFHGITSALGRKAASSSADRSGASSSKEEKS
eukprot:CAMPEP_0182445784 /NCGR_PEP_ID=MMETSP1172-20130603/3788_1 /TAXON_ID=708627 /ORGANISM="Timspurckia oligopyrenoides, Strain CCMP3278" /LENGTH=734 /DNA_ID=CAMNT_0024641609 /DNA_START=483 /DNA_END=2687 /DNA_ORIENTATION=-